MAVVGIDIRVAQQYSHGQPLARADGGRMTCLLGRGWNVALFNGHLNA